MSPFFDLLQKAKNFTTFIIIPSKREFNIIKKLSFE